jgi:hypothetical protein
MFCNLTKLFLNCLNTELQQGYWFDILRVAFFAIRSNLLLHQSKKGLKLCESQECQ